MSAHELAYHRRQSDIHRCIAVAIENGTYAALRRYEGSDFVPASWVAVELGISPQAANNRLARLESLGVCQRRAQIVAGGGRFYEYRWAAGWAATPTARDIERGEELAKEHGW